MPGEYELVIVHYKNALPTVVTLNALFRYYPKTEITLVDNSNGTCTVTEEILPHLGSFAERVKVLVNPATDEGIDGGLSHGAGLDLALHQSEAKYLISFESDTMVLAGGAIEYLLYQMEQGYDWAGAGQKPIGNGFASFTPSYAILRTDLLKAYDLSFKWRPRSAEDYSADDPLIRHHELAAEQVELGLPLKYPEGKSPETYKRTKKRLIKTELDHLDYFDTGEWIHHFLRSKGYSYYLFRWPSNACHIWGSRELDLFLTHFRERLPDLNIQDFAPAELLS